MLDFGKNKYSLFLLLLISFHLVVNFLWINSNRFPGLGDEIGQLSIITNLYRDYRYNYSYSNINMLLINIFHKEYSSLIYNISSQ